MPGFSGGGSARVMLLLAREFTAAGYAVEFVVARARGAFVEEVPDDIGLVDLGATRILTSLPALVRYLRHRRPDAMLAALSPANCVAVWARRIARVGTRLVISEHNTLSMASAQAQNWRKRLMPWVMRPSYRHADAVVAVSGGVADDLAATIGLERNRIRVVFNPVVTQSLVEQAQAPVDHAWLDGPESVILGTGRLTRQKDFATLVRAFAELRRHRAARLIVLGEGEERRELETLIDEYDLRETVDLPGFVANPYAFMGRAAVFVLSSRWEGFGNALVEAMACGTPVVSTRCPSGPAEILEEGRWGELVPVGDAAALAASMERMLDYPGPSPEPRGREFTPQSAARAYLEALFQEPSVPLAR